MKPSRGDLRDAILRTTEHMERRGIVPPGHGLGAIDEVVEARRAAERRCRGRAHAAP
jgi:hypothetical protein